MTLPAAIIVNLSDLRIQNQLLLFIVVALIWSIFQVLLAYFTTFKQENKQKATMMYLGSGFNIGNFLLPFIQNIQPAFVPMISMFDIGNSIMLTGGTQAVVDTLVATNQRFSFRNMLRQLLSSIPFMCYLIMFGLRYFQVSLPSFIHTFFVPLANANVFLSMFMIGLYLDFSLPKSGFKALVKLFFLRYFWGVLTHFCYTYFTDFNGRKNGYKFAMCFPNPFIWRYECCYYRSKRRICWFCFFTKFFVQSRLYDINYFSYELARHYPCNLAHFS